MSEVAALDGGQQSSSNSVGFTPTETYRSTHWAGGWVATRPGLDVAEKSTISAPAGKRTPTVHPAASRHSDKYKLLYRYMTIKFSAALSNKRVLIQCKKSQRNASTARLNNEPGSTDWAPLSEHCEIP